MISIHPEWVQKILNGEKTIEVRTWIPKGELPLEVLIYVAKRKYDFHVYKKDGTWTLTEKHIQHYPYKNVCGKVVGKFTLNKTYKLINMGGLGIANLDIKQPEFDEIIKKTCLDVNQIGEYLKGKDGYAWHIDDLEIFERPKELSEFKTVVHYPKNIVQIYLDYKPLKKAPQKMVWVYIDEQPELREPKVLNEETPSEKNESERKPF